MLAVEIRDNMAEALNIELNDHSVECPVNFADTYIVENRHQ